MKIPGTLWRLDAICLYVTILFATACVANPNTCDGMFGGLLIMAENAAINAYDCDLTNEVFLTMAPFPYSLDVDHEKNVVYWSDLSLRQVSAYGLGFSEPKRILDVHGEWMPSSIALDSFRQNLYVLDSASKTVRLFNLNNNYQAVVVGQNLVEVKKIAVDPYAAYLFVVNKFEIFRTDLSGEYRYTVFSMSAQSSGHQPYDIPFCVSDIALDVNDKRIYWVDTQSRKVQSSTYDGSDLRVHYQSEDHMGFETHSSLTFYEGKLYWADGLDKKIIKIDLMNQNHCEVIDKNPTAVKGVSCKNKRKAPKDPCTSRNNKCQHLCVPSANSKRFRCACNFGYKLTSNKMSCAPVHEFLLLTVARYIRGFDLSLKESSFVDVIDPSNFAVDSQTTLDFDARRNEVYFSSAFPKDKLYKIDLNTNTVNDMIPDLISNNVGRFAYDWVTKNLYYFTYYYGDMTTLSVLNVENPTYSKILLKNVADMIKYIVAHPNEGYLYFGHTTLNGDVISRVGMDGSDLQVIVQLNYPCTLGGMDMDYDNNRLYWIENMKNGDGSNYAQITHSHVSGRDIKHVAVLDSLEEFQSLAVHGETIYGVTKGGDSIIRLKKNDQVRNVERHLIGAYGDLSGLKVFSARSQTFRTNHPCASGHSCEKFCLTSPMPQGGLAGRCACPYGQKLAPDGISCVDNSAEEPPFVPCKPLTYRCDRKKVIRAPSAGRKVIDFRKLKGKADE